MRLLLRQVRRVMSAVQQVHLQALAQLVLRVAVQVQGLAPVLQVVAVVAVAVCQVVAALGQQIKVRQAVQVRLV
jgi:hypothetical protein